MKPVAAFDDHSMTETIVDMPPIKIDRNALDALPKPVEPLVSRIEPEKEPVPVAADVPPPPTSEPSVPYTPGPTSQNWSMKTGSVEIPAGLLDEDQGAPLVTDFAPEPENEAPAADLPPVSVNQEPVADAPPAAEPAPPVAEEPAPPVLEEPAPVFEPVPAAEPEAVPQQPVIESLEPTPVAVEPEPVVEPAADFSAPVEEQPVEPIVELPEEPAFEQPAPIADEIHASDLKIESPVVAEPPAPVDEEPFVPAPIPDWPSQEIPSSQPSWSFEAPVEAAFGESPVSEEKPAGIAPAEPAEPEVLPESTSSTDEPDVFPTPLSTTDEPDVFPTPLATGFEPEADAAPPVETLEPATFSPVSDELKEEPAANAPVVDSTPVADSFENAMPVGAVFEAPVTDVADATPIAEPVEPAAEIAAPAVMAEPVSEAPARVAALPETAAEAPAATEAMPEAATDSTETAAVTPEPPIAMPETPYILEHPEEIAKFDSVKIIESAPVEETPVEAAPVETPAPVLPSAAEEPAAPVAEEPKEARSFTAPNMGNTDTDGRKAAKLKPLDEGTILNVRYEIVRKIGGGGMGAVYLANDRNLGGVLRAVKEMVQSYIESDQQDKAIADFKRESLLLTSLDHPAIPTIYDYFFDEKEARFYLVMKYISGGDLAARLRSAPEGRIDEKSVTEWAIQIADVLDYLHNHEPSIVYRDLKPANVMIDGNSGRVMLIDFGIARWVNKEEKGVTAVGTMGYAPPELFSGNVEPRSDIYSLGSTMFHLLTGADPQSNPLLIFDFQKNPRPRQINPQLSDQIERILMRAVEYNAELRFASAAQMRDDLREHLSNLQTGRVTYGVKAAPSSTALSEQLVFCGFCGKQIVATDVFCAFCGAQQPIAQQGFAQPVAAPAAPTAKLVVLGTGELDPSTFKLEKTENLLGRRDPMSNIFPEVDLSKFDPQTKISRRHARIWRDGGNYLVEDLGSSNGTTLLTALSDSVRLLPHQPHALTNGDKLKLGDTTLHFTIG